MLTSYRSKQEQAKCLCFPQNSFNFFFLHQEYKFCKCKCIHNVWCGAMKYLLILFHLFLLLLLCSPYYNKWCFNNSITIKANIRTLHSYSCSNFFSLSISSSPFIAIYSFIQTPLLYTIIRYLCCFLHCVP